MLRFSAFLMLGGLLATAGPAQAQTAATFSAASAYATGANSTPNGVVVADMNGDGRPDIVTANKGSSTAGVLLGQAGGGFATASTYPTGSGPVADVSGDGRPDIVTANYDSNNVGVLLGQAAGGFAAASMYATGSAPRNVVVADVSGDGRPDIVTANVNSNTIGVLLGQATGGFATISTYTAGAGPYGLVVTDINNDGQPDIVMSNINSSSVGVLLGQAGGGFATVSTYSTGATSLPVTLAVADLDGDGRLDIVATTYFASAVRVLPGQAGGGFAAFSTYSTDPGSYPFGIAVADMNGDGRPDIVAANNSPATVNVLLGKAGGGFATTSSYPTGVQPEPFGMAVADLNNDRRPDIIVTGNSSNTVVVLLNTGTYTPLATAAGLAASVSLYPNPAAASATLTLAGLPTSVAQVQATLLDATGRTVGQQQLAATQGGARAELPTAGLAGGLCVLRLAAYDGRGELAGSLPAPRLSVR